MFEEKKSSKNAGESLFKKSQESLTFHFILKRFPTFFGGVYTPED